MRTYAFLFPLVLGFLLGGASAFTAAFSRRWGERRGQMATMILRNALGIPLWIFGYFPGGAAAAAGLPRAHAAAATRTAAALIAQREGLTGSDPDLPAA